MLLAVITVSMSGRSGALVKGQRWFSASTAFQVARPITWPAGLMAGFTTGSSVIGSSTPEQQVVQRQQQQVQQQQQQ